MPKAGVVPVCRYQHGELAKVNTTEGHAFVIDGARRVDEEKAYSYQPQNFGIVLDVFECAVCGYTELFERRES